MRKDRKVFSYGVTPQPYTYQGLLRGVDKLVDAIRPTLGPNPHMVALATSMGGQPVEIFDDGGTIARRIIQFPDRDEDMGAMFLRHLLWKMREDCGDGTATTAVLFAEILHKGILHIVNGGHAMPLRGYLEKGARLVYDEIGKQARPVMGTDMIGKIAESLCFDLDMAQKLAEIFDTVTEFGHIELRSGRGRSLDIEYVEGAFWEGNILSKTMINVPAENKALFEDTAVLVTDLAIDDPTQLVHVITEAKKAGISRLVLVCTVLSEACIGFLAADSTRKILPVIAVKTPSYQLEEQIAAVEDISVLCGAIPLTRHAGETLELVTAQHFGNARSVWSKDQFFGIVGGQGDPHQIRRHFWKLKNLYANLAVGESKSLVRNRIGKILGGTAILWVGGATDAEINFRKGVAERVVESIRGSIIKGIVPGGGMAYQACKPALKNAMLQASDPDEIAAYRILLGAMDAPFRTIVSNAGLNPDAVLTELQFSGPDAGYDVRAMKVVPRKQLEILDTTEVIQNAAFRSISGAALLLTVDVLVRHKNPETVADT
jgi:chaperonin GroEL